MRLPETVSEYSRYAAQEFLQTVVFIDDQIYQPERGSVMEPKKIVSPKRRKKVIEPVKDKPLVSTQSDQVNEPMEFSSHDIVDSFAKKGIVCSLYQPNRLASVSPAHDIFSLCLAADVVIVDWDLYGDGGERTLELVNELIQRAVRDVPEQLRLILVYTQEINLGSIANSLYEKVSASIGDDFEPLQEEGGLAFHTNNSRISILGKAGRPRIDVSEDHIVEEKDLAEIAVKEFSKLASGLLLAATLLGLAEIRKNSRKVLSKFNENLDPAFLTHKAMCPPGDDASSHLIPLLVSEIESILEDALPTPLITCSLLSDWCKNVWQPGEHLQSSDFFENVSTDIRTIAEAICLKGFDEADQVQLKLNKNVRNVRKAGKILLNSEDDDSNHRFSHLMASRTFYGDKQKTLKLGTIIRGETCEKYFLCVQPVCDSVRLNGDTKFLFVEFERRIPPVVRLRMWFSSKGR